MRWRLSTDLTMVLHAPVDIHVLNDAPLGFQSQPSAGRIVDRARDEERLTDFVEGISWESRSLRIMPRTTFRRC